MWAVALRGVCIGVDQHLVLGEKKDLDPALFQYLAGIGAVAETTAPVAEAPPADAKAAKRAEPATPATPAAPAHSDSDHKGAKAPKGAKP